MNGPGSRSSAWLRQHGDRVQIDLGDGPIGLTLGAWMLWRQEMLILSASTHRAVPLLTRLSTLARLVSPHIEQITTDPVLKDITVHSLPTAGTAPLSPDASEWQPHAIELSRTTGTQVLAISQEHYVAGVDWIRGTVEVAWHPDAASSIRAAWTCAQRNAFAHLTEQAMRDIDAALSAPLRGSHDHGRSEPWTPS